MSSRQNFTDEDYYRLMAEHAPTLSWVSDAENTTYFYNKPWLNFTGSSLINQKDKVWTEHVHKDDLDKTNAAYTAALAQKKSFSESCRLKRHDGNYLWFLVNAIPRFGSQEIFEGYVGSCTVIQELKEAELVRSEFIREAGHEIKTPLTTLTVSTQMLQTLVENGQQLDYMPELLRTMRGSLKKLDVLIDEFIDQIANKKIE